MRRSKRWALFCSGVALVVAAGFGAAFVEPAVAQETLRTRCYHQCDKVNGIWMCTWNISRCCWEVYDGNGACSEGAIETCADDCRRGTPGL